jgi:hypothetical protein
LAGWFCNCDAADKLVPNRRIEELLSYIRAGLPPVHPNRLAKVLCFRAHAKAPRMAR